MSVSTTQVLVLLYCTQYSFVFSTSKIIYIYMLVSLHGD